jgi:putative transposase
VGKDPTDRGRMGTKRSVPVDGDGGPLGVVIAGANVLERRMPRATIEAIVVERPEPTEEQEQHLSLDGGYDNPTGREAAREAKRSIRRISTAAGSRRRPVIERRVTSRGVGWWL